MLDMAGVEEEHMKYTRIVLMEFILAIALVLFLSTFGQNPNFIETFHNLSGLFRSLSTSSGINAQFNDLSAIDFWNSFRLIMFSFIFSYLLGVFLAIGSTLVKNKMMHGVYEFFTVVLEAIPEPIYIMTVYVGVFYCITNLNLNIPGMFPIAHPNWSDTFVPAIALSLPSAFYLQRVFYIQLRDELNAQYTLTALQLY